MVVRPHNRPADSCQSGGRGQRQARCARKLLQQVRGGDLLCWWLVLAAYDDKIICIPFRAVPRKVWRTRLSLTHRGSAMKYSVLLLGIAILVASAAVAAAADEQDMVCEGALSSEFTGLRWFIRVGDCELMPDALDKDRRAILKGCNPQGKFFVLCRAFARVRDAEDTTNYDIVRVY